MHINSLLADWLLYLTLTPIPLIPPSAFQVLCKSMLKKYFLISCKWMRKYMVITLKNSALWVLSYQVITKYFLIPLQEIKKYFLSTNLQRTRKALGGNSGVMHINWLSLYICSETADAKCYYLGLGWPPPYRWSLVSLDFCFGISLVSLTVCFHLWQFPFIFHLLIVSFLFYFDFRNMKVKSTDETKSRWPS